MIYGEVTANREAVVQLKLLGRRGMEIIIDAVIDTGFTDHLTLPESIVSQLGFPFIDVSRAWLADGSLVQFDIHEATIAWKGERRTVNVQVAESKPLIGMSLLYGCTVTLEILDGGQVVIETHP